jgi:ribosomal protein L37E
MSNPSRPDPKAQPPVQPKREKMRGANDEKVLCDRCGIEMFRMHAVWRCPSCGFKTDCCGW